MLADSKALLVSCLSGGSDYLFQLGESFALMLSYEIKEKFEAYSLNAYVYSRFYRRFVQQLKLTKSLSKA